MTKFSRWALIPTGIAVAIGCISCDRTPVGKVLDDKYAITTVGDGSSLFTKQYVQASELIALGKIDEAERLYGELAKKEPDSPNPYVGLGGCRLERGDFPGAREWYHKALRTEPNSVNALVGMGTSYSSEYNFTAALTNYERARSINDACPEAHYGLAMTYAHLSDKTQAKLHLARYKQLFPKSPFIGALEHAIDRPAPPISGPPNNAN